MRPRRPSVPRRVPIPANSPVPGAVTSRLMDEEGRGGRRRSVLSSRQGFSGRRHGRVRDRLHSRRCASPRWENLCRRCLLQRPGHRRAQHDSFHCPHGTAPVADHAGCSRTARVLTHPLLGFLYYAVVVTSIRLAPPPRSAATNPALSAYSGIVPRNAPDEVMTGARQASPRRCARGRAGQ